MYYLSAVDAYIYPISKPMYIVGAIWPYFLNNSFNNSSRFSLVRERLQFVLFPKYFVYLRSLLDSPPTCMGRYGHGSISREKKFQLFEF